MAPIRLHTLSSPALHSPQTCLETFKSFIESFPPCYTLFPFSLFTGATSTPKWHLQRRGLGPSESQSVALIVSLSVVGVVVFLLVFGWFRLILNREYKREARRHQRRVAKETESSSAPAAEGAAPAAEGGEAEKAEG